MNRTAFRFPQPANGMRFDGERFVSGLLGNVASGDIQSEHYHRYLFALRFCEGKDVLDVASGEGYGSHCIGQVARSVVGVDANVEAVDFANRNYLTDRVSFKIGKAQSLPITDASIDVVISFETLEHFAEHEIFLSEVRRVLRFGGLLVISSPNRTVYTEEANYHNEWHLRELDRREFLAYLSDGFANVRMFAQRPLAGSVIAIDDDATGGRPEGFMLRGEGVFDRTEGIPHPPFFVALASDAALPPAQSSILQNPGLLLHIDGQRRNAEERAAEVAATVAGLEAELANARQQHAEPSARVVTLEAALAQRSIQAVDLEAELATAREAHAQAANQAANLEAALATAREEHAEAANVEAALVAAREEHAEAYVRIGNLEDALARATREWAERETAALAERTLADEALRNALSERDALVRTAGEKDALVRNLRFDLERVALSAAEGQLAQEQLTLLQTSTMWRATSPVRQALIATPPGLRRSVRHAARLLWWTATFRLPSKLRIVREMNLRIAADSAGVNSAGAKSSGIKSISAPASAAAHSTVAHPDMFAVRMQQPRGRIAAVAHLYYKELWPELRKALGAIPERFDLFVSVTHGPAEEAIGQIYADFPTAQIAVFPNHGRDILPFITFAETGVLNRYDLVCKLHGKRTEQRRDGDAWRQTLLGGVLRDRDQVRTIIEAFEADPDLGIVVADGQVFGGRPEHWVDNRVRVMELGARIGLESIPEQMTFPGGSIFWIRPFLLRTLVGLKLALTDFEAEPLPPDGTTAHAVERLVGIVCADAGMRIAESGALPSTRTLVTQAPAAKANVHVIAYYLPQYHPTPENDAWWGEGFTEWTNATRTLPVFRHHRQPRLPGHLGFYDLRVPETREAQAELARRYGVEGFCYYYYWFNGRGMLRRPLEEMVSSGRPDFPFMICWANEPWSRNWDGGNRELLLPQDYTPGWAETFARDVAPLLKDPRYIRLNGCPVLLIYRVMHIPDRLAAMNGLRQELLRLGVGEVHLGGGWVGFPNDEEPPENPARCGLDSWFEFPPHRLVAAEITPAMADLNLAYKGKVYSYRSAVDISIKALETAKPHTHRSVMAGWDNTPRRSMDGNAFHGATPALLRRWLRAVVRSEAARPGGGERIVFVNAWNEWAEGTYLEPDRDFGLGWLEAVASATGQDMTRPPVLDVEPEFEAIPQPAPDPALTTARDPAGSSPAAATDPAAMTDPASMTDHEWLDLMIRSAEAQRSQGLNLPPFPAPAWQAQFVGSSDALAMREAATFRTLVKQELAALGRAVSGDDRVLDFGCGWGRFIRLWMKDIPATNLFGVDVDPDMIGFCRISGLPAQFAVVPPLGPTEFETGSLDLIYAYSVFSHLSEPTHVAWMEEFRRILKPGGILIFTTQARHFLSWTVALRDRPADELSVWESSLCTAFGDVGRRIADYDAGAFVFAPTGGGEYRPSSFYGEAAIPEAWLRARWDDNGFTLRVFIDEPTRCAQAVAIMQRQ